MVFVMIKTILRIDGDEEEQQSPPPPHKGYWQCGVCLYSTILGRLLRSRMQDVLIELAAYALGLGLSSEIDFPNNLYFHRQDSGERSHTWSCLW